MGDISTGEITMITRKTPRISTFAGMIALSLSAWIPSVSTADQASFKPIESISYEFGSKHMSGYFVQEAHTCVVTLMVIDRDNSDQVPTVSPTRLRLLLQPEQIAGLDSEEGRSLNLTCGDQASTLLVDLGERDRLVALQKLASQKFAAVAHE
jgi:hypothetical protein